MGTVYKYIHANYDNKPDVNAVAANVHLSTAAFCRYFKKQTKITFTDFVNQYRITQAKTLLLKDLSVSEACYEVGLKACHILINYLRNSPVKILLPLKKGIRVKFVLIYQNA